MKSRLRKNFVVFWWLITIASGLLTHAHSADEYRGYFAREGNNQSPSITSGNNTYIKLYDNRWVAMLYIPYPYAKSVTEEEINHVFKQIKLQARSSALMRGKFGVLKEFATVQFERFGYLGDKLVFECGALSPCTIQLHDSYLELIKPGVINEHIIKFDYIVN